MRYNIHYACVSHIGKCRSINQDNFICNGMFLGLNECNVQFPLCGIISVKDTPVFGIFDGMGGEECGEIASYLAAKNAYDITINNKALEDLAQFCQKANSDICEYAAVNDISAMGTTAAMLAFTDKEIALCNIGDSKIFRFSNEQLEQISQDHVAIAAFGMKPPLSQNLGIPPDEMIIDPYFARGEYNNGDIYLICSDGLTDMVTNEEISEILAEGSINENTEKLLSKALENGGKDNTTIILLEIQRQKNKLFNFFRKNGGRK